MSTQADSSIARLNKPENIEKCQFVYMDTPNIAYFDRLLKRPKIILICGLSGS